jgi:aerobic-type carbon monoxide dehydrogenase small subunit (CoxS/CutS family)
MRIRVTINGEAYERDVEPRLLLADFLRHELALTGTHVGCEHGVCGACTVLVDGATARSCLLFATQLDGARVTTVEGLARDGEPQPIQDAFHENHALQCGYCTPGFLVAVHRLHQHRQGRARRRRAAPRDGRAPRPGLRRSEWRTRRRRDMWDAACSGWRTTSS